MTDNKDRQQRMALIKELETLIQVGRHPNIVSLVGACTFEGKGSAIQKVTANIGGQVVSIKICVVYENKISEKTIVLWVQSLRLISMI